MFSHLSDQELIEAWKTNRSICANLSRALKKGERTQTQDLERIKSMTAASQNIAELEKEAADRHLVLNDAEDQVEKFEFPEASPNTYW